MVSFVLDQLFLTGGSRSATRILDSGAASGATSDSSQRLFPVNQSPPIVRCRSAANRVASYFQYSRRNVQAPEILDSCLGVERGLSHTISSRPSVGNFDKQQDVARARMIVIVGVRSTNHRDIGLRLVHGTEL